MSAKHVDGIVDDKIVDLGEGTDGRGLWMIEQDAHFADHRTRGLDGRHILPVADDLEFTLLEYIEGARQAALFDERHAGCDPVASEPGFGHLSPLIAAGRC